MKLFYLLLISIIFIGCSKDTPQITLPNWYINQENNNAINIYGAGEGNSIDEAKNNALNNMSSRLIVSVGSTIETKTTSSTTNGYSKDVSQDLKVEVEKIQFTNYNTTNSMYLDGKYYMQVNINRSELFNNHLTEFYANDSKITNTITKLNSLSLFERIITLQNIYPDIIKNKKSAFVLYAIDNSFDYGEYFKKYDSYIDEITNLKNSIFISAISNESKNYFLDEVIDLLNQQKYKVSKTDTSDVEVKIDNKVRYSEARGWQIAKVSTTLTISVSGKIFSNKTIQTVGRSSSTKENALADAAKSFKNELLKLGIDNIIFIEKR